jgi:hypothetical protein
MTGRSPREGPVGRTSVDLRPELLVKTAPDTAAVDMRWRGTAADPGAEAPPPHGNRSCLSAYCVELRTALHVGCIAGLRTVRAPSSIVCRWAISVWLAQLAWVGRYCPFTEHGFGWRF